MAEGLHQQRNDSMIQALIGDMENWTVGAEGGKVVFRSSDEEWNKTAGHWLNTVFAYECDYRNQRTSLYDFYRIGVGSIVRDGDFLVVLDRKLFDGKIMVFECDQITNLDAAGFSDLTKSGKYADCSQQDGVIVDKWGSVQAYVVTGKRYMTQVRADDAEVIPAKSCALVLKPYRFNQLRGESALLRLLEITDALRNLVTNEVESAKRIAEDAIYLKKADPLDGVGVTADDATALGMPRAIFTGPRPEGISGGVQVIGKDDEITAVTNPRPSRNVWDFGDWFARRAYKSVGLYSVMATGVAQYPQQAKAEILLSYVAIRVWQRVIEDRMANFLIEQAVDIGVQSGKVAAPPADWKHYNVIWPKAPVAELEQSLKDTLDKIKCGASSFEKEFGADWQYTVAELAKEKDLLIEFGLENLDFFSTVAGKNEAMNNQDPAAPKAAPAEEAKFAALGRKIMNLLKGKI